MGFSSALTVKELERRPVEPIIEMVDIRFAINEEIQIEILLHIFVLST